MQQSFCCTAGLCNRSLTPKSKEEELSHGHLCGESEALGGQKWLITASRPKVSRQVTATQAKMSYHYVVHTAEYNLENIPINHLQMKAV